MEKMGSMSFAKKYVKSICCQRRDFRSYDLAIRLSSAGCSSYRNFGMPYCLMAWPFLCSLLARIPCGVSSASVTTDSKCFPIERKRPSYNVGTQLSHRLALSRLLPLVTLTQSAPTLAISCWAASSRSFQPPT